LRKYFITGICNPYQLGKIASTGISWPFASGSSDGDSLLRPHPCSVRSCAVRRFAARRANRSVPALSKKEADAARHARVMWRAERCAWQGGTPSGVEYLQDQGPNKFEAPAGGHFRFFPLTILQSLPTVR
jgi:hypothetical protein